MRKNMELAKEQVISPEFYIRESEQKTKEDDRLVSFRDDL